MSGSISSAEPLVLFRYAESGQELNERLRQRGSHLFHALNRFTSTCTEYRIGVDVSLANGLAHHVNVRAQQDAWLKQVGMAFLRADSGWIGRSAWRAADSAIRQIERNSRVLGDAAAWLRSCQPSPALGVLRAIMRRIQRIATQIVEAIQAFLDLAGGRRRIEVCSPYRRPWWEWLLEEIRNWLRRIWNWMLGWLQSLLEAIRQRLRELWNGIIEVARSFSNWIQRMVWQAVQFLMELVPPVVQLAATLVANIAQGLNWIWQTALTTWNAIIRPVQQVGESIWNQLQQIGNWLREGARWLRSQIDNLVQSLRETFQRIQILLGVTLIALLNLVSRLTGWIVHQVAEAVRHILDAIEGIVASLAGWAWEAFAWLIETILSQDWIFWMLEKVIENLEIPAYVWNHPIGRGILIYIAIFAPGIAAIIGGIAIVIRINRRALLDWLLDSMRYIEGEQRIRIAGLIDKRLQQLGHSWEAQKRNGSWSEDPKQVFPGLDTSDPRAARVPPEALMAGENAIISPYDDEEVTIAQLRENEYLFGVYGLNISRIPEGDPMNLESVMETAELPLDRQSENEYYRKLRDVFLNSLRNVPAGGVIHLTGHSMGAGVIMLLLNDT